MKYVIDSNVLVAANGPQNHIGIECAAKSARFLADARRDIIYEDDAGMAFSEYRKHCSMSGQPGPGDAFLRWFVQNRFNALHCQQVAVGDVSSVSANVPKSLQSFDADDHKWIAVYLAAGADHVVNAVDSDWADARDCLVAEGIDVLELCSVILRVGRKRKPGQSRARRAP